MDIYQNGSYASISALFGGGNQNAGHGFMESMKRFTSVANIADSVKTTLMDMTNDYNFGAFSRKIKAATNQMNKVFDDDCIKVMVNVKQIQVAKPRMQRAISANPVLKRLVLNGTCEGYDGYEYDNNRIGAFDHNYQSIRNGVLCKDEGMDGKERYGMTTYQNSGGLANLSIYERHSLNVTYRHLEKSIDEDLSDPTSKWDELMK